MYQVDPRQLVMMIKQGYNPEQLLMSVLESRMGGTPLGQNLLTLAKNGQTQEIENIVRNLYAQQGKDFDQDFKIFRQKLGL